LSNEQQIAIESLERDAAAQIGAIRAGGGQDVEGRCNAVRRDVAQSALSVMSAEQREKFNETYAGPADVKGVAGNSTGKQGAKGDKSVRDVVRDSDGAEGVGPRPLVVPNSLPPVTVTYPNPTPIPVTTRTQSGGSGPSDSYLSMRTPSPIKPYQYGTPSPVTPYQMGTPSPIATPKPVSTPGAIQPYHMNTPSPMSPPHTYATPHAYDAPKHY